MPNSSHLLRVRERRGELLFNVVRVDDTGRYSPTEDRHAEEEWCDAFFGTVRSSLQESGIQTSMLRQVDAGRRNVDVMSTAQVEEQFGAAEAARVKAAQKSRSKTHTPKERARKK